MLSPILPNKKIPKNATRAIRRLGYLFKTASNSNPMSGGGYMRGFETAEPHRTLSLGSLPIEATRTKIEIALSSSPAQARNNHPIASVRPQSHQYLSSPMRQGSHQLCQSKGMPVLREMSRRSWMIGMMSGTPFSRRNFSASRSGSPGISGPAVPGAGLVARKTRM